MSKKFTWLHLSDLHFRDKDQYDQSIVINGLLEDVHSLMQAEGPKPNAIFITGDIAYSGKVSEYEIADKFLNQISKITGLNNSQIFLVPGNHDVDRSSISQFFLNASSVLTDRKSLTALIGNPNEVSLFTERHRNYSEFIKRFPWSQNFSRSGLSYTSNFVVNDVKISVIGLNSAWLTGIGVDKGNVIVGERQVREALDAIEHPQLLISLLHHPPSYLKEFDDHDVRSLLEQRCDFVLHGHVHELGALNVASPDSAMFYFASGANYVGRTELLSYNVVSIDLNIGDGKVFLRSYSDRLSGWVADTGTYRSAPEGNFVFHLPERLVKRPQPDIDAVKIVKEVSLTKIDAQVLPPPEPEPVTPNIPASLYEAISKRKCLLFAGAGASADAKLPTWGQLLSDMVDELGKVGALEEGEMNELQKLIQNKEYLVIAPFCMERLGKYEFAQFLRNSFDDLNKFSKTHRILSKINFRGAITTNFDPFIERSRERARVIMPTKMEELGAPGVDQLVNDPTSFPVIKMHGSYEDIDSLVLTHADFRKILFQKPKYREFLKRLFTDSIIFFYGYSFTDPNVDFALQEIMTTYDGKTPPHYALLPDPGKLKRQFLFNNYNIRVIPYNIWENSHIAAYRFLENIANNHL